VLSIISMYANCYNRPLVIVSCTFGSNDKWRLKHGDCRHDITKHLQRCGEWGRVQLRVATSP
jgi:hypothetical protein